MDLDAAAVELKKHTAAIRKCDRIIAELEQKLNSLQKQVLMSAIENNESVHLRLLTRLSVAEGVYNMYRTYRARKISEKQQMTESIKSQLSEDDNDVIDDIITSVTSSATIPTPDQAADQWTATNCRLTRLE